QRQRVHDTRHLVRAMDPRREVFEGAEVIVLPTEFAPGGNLRQWLAERHEDSDARIEQGLELFRQACRGVAALHEAGLVHLDLQPDNIMLCTQRHGAPLAKVSDLGTTRLSGVTLTTGGRERGGSGTPAYMAPEQFRAQRQMDIGPAADIYALGVILF